MTRLGSKGFLNYSVQIKEMFFDRQRVEQAIDQTTHKVLHWFGGRVREKTRQYIGKPNVAGRLVTIKGGKNKGKTKRVRDRRPRAPGKPPVARVDDSSNVTLRNVQYQADVDVLGDKASVRIFGVRFPRTNRYTRRSLSAPELHEFGGTIKARAKVGVLKDKRGKPTTRKTLWFNSKLPYKTFKIPKRPYLKPTFDKVVKEANERAAAGKTPFKFKGL